MEKQTIITKKLIGQIEVCSGQLIICDPGYIDNEWKDTPFMDIRIYRNKKTGETLQYRKDFDSYGQVIEKYGTTMNQLNSTGEWEDVDMGQSGEFSYNGCCEATSSEDEYGLLYGELGDPNVAVAFTTNGDGVYPVYAIYDKDGMLKKVEVHF